MKKALWLQLPRYAQAPPDLTAGAELARYRNGFSLRKTHSGAGPGRTNLQSAGQGMASAAGKQMVPGLSETHRPACTGDSMPPFSGPTRNAAALQGVLDTGFSGGAQMAWGPSGTRERAWLALSRWDL